MRRGVKFRIYRVKSIQELQPTLDTFLILRLGIAAGLVAANAFFVVAEYSLIRVRPTRLRQLSAEGHGAADVALRLIDRMDALLSAGQLGVTMASLGLGWAGEDTLAQMLTPLFGTGLGHLISLGIAFLGISVMHIILGELVPKSLAFAHSERLAMLVARPMELAVLATWPVMRFVTQAASAVARVLGGARDNRQHTHSAEELKMLVTAGRKGGALPPAQEAMIHRLLDLDQMQVREIMVPRVDLICAPVTATLEDLVRLVFETHHSRIPVYEGTPEKIIGVVYAMELFRVWLVRLRHGSASFTLRQWVRALPIVPETKRLDELFEQFRAEHRHIALVVDEFGRTAGLVTMEDILESVVGELIDEMDVEERPQLSPAEAPVELEGSTTLLDLENLYGIELPRESGFETLGGFALWRLAAVPKGGEQFEYAGWHFTIIEMDRRRVALVRVEKVRATSRPASS